MTSLESLLRIDFWIVHADQALGKNGLFSERRSTSMSNLPTLFHSPYLAIGIAEKIWRAGFRDVDVSDKDNLTPLIIAMSSRITVLIQIIF